MATVEIKLELVGSVEGVPVEIKGHGLVDTGSGQLTLDVHSARRLLLFDTAFAAVSLLDVLALAVFGSRPRPEAEPESEAHVRSRTDLFDENGREAGGWRVVAALGHTGGGLRLEGQILDCRQRIEPGERVAAVDALWRLTAQSLEPEGMLLTCAWGARSGRGNGYRGMGMSVVEGHAWPGGSEFPAKVELQDFRVRPVAGAAGELVSLTARYSR